MEPFNEKLLGEFELMRTDLAAIKNALLPTDYNNKLGIVTIVRDHENRLELIDKKIQNAKWLLVGLSLGSGIGIGTVLGALVDIFG